MDSSRASHIADTAKVSGLASIAAFATASDSSRASHKADSSALALFAVKSDSSRASHTADTAKMAINATHATIADSVKSKTGNCTVHPWRCATCSTWFCKFAAGEDGSLFWKSLHPLLSLLENSVSEYCALTLGRGEAISLPLKAANIDLQPEDLDGNPHAENSGANGLARKKSISSPATKQPKNSLPMKPRISAESVCRSIRKTSPA